MNVRSIPRAAIKTSIRMTRLPLDISFAVLSVEKRGAKLALDRADATARSLAGMLLSDDVLQEDGARRRAAAEERGRAVRLREQAAETAEEADQRVEQRHRQAQRRRRE